MLIANAIVVVVLVLLWASHDYLAAYVFQRVTYSSNSGFSTDMQPVELTLYDKSTQAQLDLRVPKAYLTDARNWRGGKQQQVEIQAMLADMRPRALVEQEDGATGNARRDVLREMVYIALEPGIYEDSPAEALLRTSGHTSRQSDQYGLQRYRDVECTGRSDDCRVIGYDEVFLGSDAPEKVYIRCARPDIVRDGGCYASTIFRSRLLRYTFQRSKLPQWRDIDGRARKLLEGFVVADRRAVVK